MASCDTCTALSPGTGSGKQPAIEAGDQPARNRSTTTDRSRGDRSTANSFGRRRAAVAVLSAVTAR
jgi:hypothetical protein